MPLLAASDVTQQTIIEHGLIGNLIVGLKSALGWQVHEGDFSRKLSTLRFMAQCFQRHMGRLMNLEENDGYMDLVEEMCPRLGRKVDGLRSEHGQFREASRRIVVRLEQVAPTDWDTFGGICDELGALLQHVGEHTRKEVALVQESFDQDSSGGEG